MLGLGNTLVNGGSLEEVPFSFTYTSDFTSDADGFSYLSGNIPQANTITHNATGPDGNAGWLKVEFTEDHSNQINWQLMRDMSDQDAAYSLTGASDTVTWSFDIHFDGGANDAWGGTDDVDVAQAGLDPKVRSFSAAQDQTVTISSPSTPAGAGTAPKFSIKFTENDDYPNNGAILYLKNVSISVSGVR